MGVLQNSTSAARPSFNKSWALGKSKPIKGEDRRYCIRLAFKVSGTYENAGDIKWNEEWTEWQYTSGVCIAPASYTAVRYDVSYQRNVNYARFCDFALYREEFGTSYAYDPDGNILSIFQADKSRDVAQKTACLPNQGMLL